jgi:hypothetical protein
MSVLIHDTNLAEQDSEQENKYTKRIKEVNNLYATECVTASLGASICVGPDGSRELPAEWIELRA